MSDRPKSTVSPTPASSAAPPPPPEPDWERHPTFRHTFLAHLPPDVAEAAEHLGRGLYHLVLALPGEPHRGSWTAARLQATAADLRFHAAHLAALAEERHTSSLSSTDFHLSEWSLPWALQLEEVAERIESALDVAGR